MYNVHVLEHYRKFQKILQGSSKYFTDLEHAKRFHKVLESSPIESTFFDNFYRIFGLMGTLTGNITLNS
jgi:hypothetical protein